MVAKDDWAKIISMEEISWRQKSRALWLKSSDRNTKLFHRLANMHRMLTLSFVVVDGVQYAALLDLKHAIYNFYKSGFFESESWRPKLIDCHCRCYGTLIRSLLRCLSVRKKLLKPF